jgi:hypothetical protein
MAESSNSNSNSFSAQYQSLTKTELGHPTICEKIFLEMKGKGKFY